MSLRSPRHSGIASLLFLVALAAPGAAAAQATSDTAFERDREAILAMAGTFAVSFSFRETVALTHGYELQPEKPSAAHEVVFVVDDEGDRIVLQHVLVTGGPRPMPVKHWRQDWIYEPEQIFDYVGDNTFEQRRLGAEEREGTWAQLVYQVDDSPRYAAVAAWSHRNGVSTWDAPEAWRPLPRREATTRDDYDVMVARNRHVITPDGWVHEQDNSKLVLGEAPHYLAREIGVNTYVRSDDFPVQVAETYWAETQDYWALVREEWLDIGERYARYGIALEGETDALYGPVLGLANEYRTHEMALEAAVTSAQDMMAQHVVGVLARR